jgi:hypothetical protein
LEPEEKKLREPGTGREESRRAWNRKREEQGSLKPEVGR